MIDALIGGRLHGKAVQRIGGSGKPFVVCKVRTPVDGESLFVNVIAFSESVGNSLLALEEGDSVALSGALTPKVWTPANGAPKPVLDLVCHSVTTTYHVQRKRQAMQPTPAMNGNAHMAAMAPLPDDDFMPQGERR